MLEIRTGKYKTERKVLVDGNEWTVKVLGAGDELAMSQAQRRINQLDQKIKAGTATDADYDTYDKLENAIFKTFRGMFRDTTEGNKYVNEWLDSTPLSVINATIEDIRKQAEANEKAQENGDNTPAPAN